MTRIHQAFFKSKYKHVQGRISRDRKYWVFRIVGKTRQEYNTEKEAALAADKYLISIGKEPVNILKRK